MSCTTTTYLPEELMRAIFTRLPVKTLIRFKSISKSCCSLIEEQSFIDSHTNQGFNNKSRLIVHSYDFDDMKTKFYSVQVDSVLCDDIVKEISPLPSAISRYESSDDCNFRLLGSCNGLVCLTYHSGRVRLLAKKFIIWNIATRECHEVPVDYKILPKSYGDDLQRQDFGIKENLCIGFGFGHEPVGDDYKFVVISKFLSMVYSLKKNQWSWKLHDSNLGTALIGRVVFANGALHWRDRLRAGRIHGFDLQLEEYFEVPPPLDYPPISDSIYQLGVMGGCLFLVGGFDEEIQVWSTTVLDLRSICPPIFFSDGANKASWPTDLDLRSTSPPIFLFDGEIQADTGALLLFKEVAKEPVRLRLSFDQLDILRIAAADNQRSIDIGHKQLEEVRVYQETLTRISYYVGQR